MEKCKENMEHSVFIIPRVRQSNKFEKITFHQAASL